MFWVGELPTQNNPVPNTRSSWDSRWLLNFGGYDNPDPDRRTAGFLPAGFLPRQNPFYVALPYNDVTSKRTKDEAARVIPWFKEAFVQDGKSVCHNRWIAIHYRGRVCFAQWSDCGPFTTCDAPYVFGSSRPSNKRNAGAGLDISPAVRDFLGFASGEKCDWRFVDVLEVAEGPWKQFGANNPFAPRQMPDTKPVFAAEFKVSTERPVGRKAKESDKIPTSGIRPPSGGGVPGRARLEELRAARERWFGGK
ncbi:MAG: hypothetical protein K1X78_23025 [Verrucomicrobiaceae bacterium]|nr:hypothetical protein [Verrucomicrobiaceae bacterium]